MAVETIVSDEEDKVTDSFEWTPENEVHLFNAMKNRRPVGLNRNFQMLFISETFNSLTNKEVPSSVLWDHISELYDMDTLNDDDSPASSVVDDKDFALTSDFDDLLEEKLNNHSESSAPAISSSSKATSLLKPSGNSTPKQNKSDRKSESSRKESRSVKEEENKGDDASKSAKKKSRPTENASKSSTPSSSKKRRN